MRFSAAAVLLFVAGFALPVCAQRGGSSAGGGAHGGGGFTGHAAPAFRGGASYAAPRYGGATVGSGYGGHNGWRDGNHGGNGYRGPGYYRGPVWGGALLGGGYLGYPGYGYGDYGDMDASGYDNSAAAGTGPSYDPNSNYDANFGPAGPPPDYGAGVTGGYGAGPAPNYVAGPPPSGYAAGPSAGYAAPASQGYRLAYPAGTASAAPAAPVGDEDAVTLVFKDGRPVQHIHNYAMTRTTLYVQDQHHREIPIEDLDLAATVKANREAGVSFAVPQGVQ